MISWNRNTTSFSLRTHSSQLYLPDPFNRGKDKMIGIIDKSIATRPYYALRMHQRAVTIARVQRGALSRPLFERTGREVREMETAAI